MDPSFSKFTANFHHLRATFEHHGKSTTAPTYRSASEASADTSVQRSATRVRSLRKSIDSIMDAPAASSPTTTPPPVRPLAKLRPSWIGPHPSERAVASNMNASKQSVLVEYASPGLQPPVYICTSLSEPQWDPIEMHSVVDEHGDYIFSRTFQVESGEYQYKFRLGEGDWWVCDESKPTVDDSQGNKNNLLLVKSPQVVEVQEDSSKLSAAALDSSERQSALQAPEVVPLPQPALQPVSIMTPDCYDSAAATPLEKHETFEQGNHAVIEQVSGKQAEASIESQEDDMSNSYRDMLLNHETLKTQMREGTESATRDDNDSSSRNGEDDEMLLARYETVAKPVEDDEQFPIFARSENLDYEPPSPVLEGSSVPEEAGPSAGTLERFPTHHAGIMELIARICERLPEDETFDECLTGLPASRVTSGLPATVRTLPIVDEEREEPSPKPTELEEEEMKREETRAEELDSPESCTTFTPPLTLQAEEADTAPMAASPQEVTEVGEPILAELLTERKNLMEVLLDKTGGSAMAVFVGILVVITGICMIQFL